MAGIRARVICCLLTLVIVQMALGQQGRKQRRFKEGDEIEYLWVSTWYPGTVLAVDGNAVAIEYMWGNTLKRERVEAFKLRHAWESKAITPMRFWSDQSKQFKVRAAAVGLKDGFVKLHKDDGSEISVPVDKLSEADQKVLGRLQQQAGPPVPELPGLSQFQKSPMRGYEWNKASDLASVPADAPPSFAKVPMKGVAFPAAHFFESLIRVHPIGGSDGWMVAGTIDSTGEVPGRVLWAALTPGQIKRVHLIPPGERLTAIEPTTRQFLTVNTEGPRLTLWSADPSVEVAKPIKSWISVAQENWGSWNNWADIITSQRILHEWGKNQYVVWDVESEREVYRIEQESFFAARPTLSPGKRYIALPEDDRVRIIEAATGKTMASLPVEGGSSAGVGFSPDGKRLAVLTRSQLAVWTFERSEEPERFRADAIGTPFTATVEWVDDHSLLIDRETLFDTRLQLPVWSYKAKTFEVKKDSYGEKTQTVLGGKLCYAVNVRTPQTGFVVGAVDLPGPAVRETVEGLDPDSLYVIRRGHRVSTNVQCGQFNQQVQQALLKQIQDNGWVYDATSRTVLKAEMGRGETQTVNYRMQSFSGGSESTHSVTVTPHFSRLQIIHNGVSAWYTGGGSGAPPVIFLTEGESAQAKASEMQRPDVELFSRADVPEKIFDPAKKNGLGSSLISARGLTPQ